MRPRGVIAYSVRGYYAGHPPQMDANYRQHQFHATTILNVRKGDKVVMIGDGQISLGNTVFKNTAKKLRRIDPDIVCGFAGSAADCLALIELLERQFLKYPGQTMRACLSLAMMWRTNKMHSKLQADLIVSDPDITILLDGSGNCIEVENGCVGIGSGSLFAQSAATALLQVESPELTAEYIAKTSMQIAADLCIYTNHNTIMEVIPNRQNQKADEPKSENTDKVSEHNVELDQANENNKKDD